MCRWNRALPIAALLTAFYLVNGGCKSVSPVPEELPMRIPVTEAEEWALDILDRLSLPQKVSQLFSTQTRGRFYSDADEEYRRLVDLVENFGIGGIIFSIGEPLAQVTLTNDLQARAELPLLISIDGEWGMGMRLDRTTTFPRAMAVGATGDPGLAYRMGLAVAEEARALGVHQNYAPVADVNNNPGNPVINTRSFGGSPELVSDFVTAYARGMEDGGILSTAKHFPGHGDTAVDSHLDLPVLPFDRARLDTLELVPFENAIEAGISSVMVAHLAFPALETDARVPATLSSHVVDELLRKDLSFSGLVVTDAMVMQGITKYFGAGEAAVRALEAGIDQILMSPDEYAARSAILEAVRTGRLTEAQIDRAVFRVLRAKAMLNLHRRREVDVQAVKDHVSTPEHLALRNEIARRSLTLLRNEGNLFPILDPTKRLLVVSLSDDSDPESGAGFVAALRAASPASAITHRLLDRRSDPGEFAQVVDEASRFDVVLAPTYLRVRSSSGEIALPTKYRDFLNRLIAGTTPVALLSLGNPYMIIGLEEPEVYAAAYGESEATLEALAEAIFGRAGFSGRLPVEIPGVYALGEGLETSAVRSREAIAEEIGMRTDRLERVDSLMRAAIRSHAFPGAAVAVGRSDAVVKLDGYGYFTYNSEQRVTPQSLFDMASLTKVVATTTAVMKLYDEGKLDLEAPVVRYLPEFGRNGKEKVTVRHLMTHTGGLVAFRRFYDEGITTREGVLEAIYGEGLQNEPGTVYRYSDLGMIVMAQVVERITGRPFSDYLHEAIFEPLGMKRTGFRTLQEPDNAEVVPTEVDDFFRHKLVQGEVHDETAWILGGTSGHAGLFSCAEDLALFAQMLLNHGRANGSRFLKAETIRLFTTRVPNTIGHTRALGWDTRADDGSSSAGAKLGIRSFGHTGFTGTSLWIDPDADLFVILLSNRVYPTRQNLRIGPVRSTLADLVFDSLKPEARGPVPTGGAVAR